MAEIRSSAASTRRARTREHPGRIGPPSSPHGRQSETLSLAHAAEILLEECRMVLPGIQALFGFQLIVVFNPSFAQSLSPGEQRLHLVAIGLLAIAVAIIMTPAAAHRQISATTVTRAFIVTATRLLLWSMLPLALGICIDFYLVARMILGAGPWVRALAFALFVVFAGLWFVLPRARRLPRRLAMEEGA